MNKVPVAAHAANEPHVMRTSGQQSLPKRTYRLRMLGMGLATLPLAVVMHELQSSWIAWSWMLLTCWLWPHLAYARAIRTRAHSVEGYGCSSR